MSKGSVYYWSTKDKWVAAIKIKGKKHVRYATSQDDAEKKLQELRLNLGLLSAQSTPDTAVSSPVQDTSITLGEWSEQWLANMSGDLRPSTINTYQSTIRMIVEPLSHIPLAALTPAMLDQVLSGLKTQGRGPRRVQQGFTVLRSCLDYAVQMDLLPSNPLGKVRRPKSTPKPTIYWNLDELRRFIHVGLQGRRRWDPFWVFLVSTGMRISEALGLTWEDIDLENRTAQIRRAMVWVQKEYLEQAPKTRAGQRQIFLTDPAYEALLIWREQYPDRTLFRTENGTIARQRDFIKALDRLIYDAQVTRVTPHGLRHVAAMAALKATGDPHAVQRYLGHSSVQVTLGIYGYAHSGDEEVASKLNSVFSSVEPRETPTE